MDLLARKYCFFRKLITMDDEIENLRENRKQRIKKTLNNGT